MRPRAWDLTPTCGRVTPLVFALTLSLGPALSWASDLGVTIHSAGLVAGRHGMLVAATLHNDDEHDVLVLLDEARTLLPDDPDAGCAPDSERLRATPVVALRRTAERGRD